MFNFKYQQVRVLILLSLPYFLYQNFLPSAETADPFVVFSNTTLNKSLRIVGRRKTIPQNESSMAGQHLEIDEFLGIPYAGKPLGMRRWMDTKVLSPITLANSTNSTLLAQSLAKACPQEALESMEDLDPTQDILANMSEDCLYLNIWRPSNLIENSRLPVMVWFHGGGFVRNSIRHPKTFGNILSSHGVVVVTVDYRLGPLGFFGFPGLNEEQQAQGLTGNYGLIDVINSLKWVQNNIAKFGGNPGNVTIFGTSAGGAIVNTLMASPYIQSLAKPLFHKAISQSGGGMGKKIPVMASAAASGGGQCAAVRVRFME